MRSESNGHASKSYKEIEVIDLDSEGDEEVTTASLRQSPQTEREADQQHPFPTVHPALTIMPVTSNGHPVVNSSTVMNGGFIVEGGAKVNGDAYVNVGMLAGQNNGKPQSLLLTPLSGQAQVNASPLHTCTLCSPPSSFRSADELCWHLTKVDFADTFDRALRRFSQRVKLNTDLPSCAAYPKCNRKIKSDKNSFNSHLGGDHGTALALMHWRDLCRKGLRRDRDKKTNRLIFKCSETGEAFSTDYAVDAYLAEKRLAEDHRKKIELLFPSQSQGSVNAELCLLCGIRPPNLLIHLMDFCLHTPLQELRRRFPKGNASMQVS